MSATVALLVTAAPVPLLLGQTATPVPITRPSIGTIPLAHGTVSISSTEVDGLVKAFFSNAKLYANSCGNATDYPHQMKFTKTGVAALAVPLGRMEYALTADEKSRTTGNFWSGIPLIATQAGQIRTKTVRTCTEYWTPELWMGAVNTGQLKVRIKFHTIQRAPTVATSFPTTTPLAKTRRIVEHNYAQSDAPIVGPVLVAAGWIDTWEWNHPYADATIKDYHNGQSYLVVSLSPSFANGAVTYVVAGAAWEMTGGAFMHSHSFGNGILDTDFLLFTQLPDLPNRILAYNESTKNSVRSFAASVFNKADFKSLLSQSLLNLARQKVPVGKTITNVYGYGSEIKVAY